MKSQKPLSRKENIVVQELEGEVLVYDLGNNKAFCLNETSAIVWEACDGNRSIPEISELVGKKLNSSANEELVWLALDQLKNEQLLNDSENLEITFNGLSRREAVRKVGLASLVALPVIMGITAPAAHAAGSACGTVQNSFCQCFDSSCNGPATSTNFPAGTTCTPVVGGSNCAAAGATCACISTGNCQNIVGNVAGTCGLG